MKIKLQKYQAGGEMAAGAPAEDPTMAAGAPAPEAQGGNPEELLMQLAQVAAQALQNQDCEAAMAVCQGFIQMIQQMQGGGAPEGEPVYKRGGKLVKRVF